jgi:hypothetical protein
MGKPTLNVGTIEGGNTVNAVPDAARIGVDIRTVPGMNHEELLLRLKKLLGDADIDVFSNLLPVWTAPDNDWMQRVFEICKPYVGEAPAARTAPYMTDAANLLGLRRRATVCGPGEAVMAHQTDEYCGMERLRQSIEIRIILDWCIPEVRLTPFFAIFTLIDQPRCTFGAPPMLCGDEQEQPLCLERHATRLRRRKQSSPSSASRCSRARGGGFASPRC